ncbi:hypothetical protein CHUAL_001687 [Chamberlinius hualienensis]
MICTVYGCNVHSRHLKKSGLHLFQFPKDKHLRKQWLHLCRRKDKVNLKHATICSLHFTDDDFMNKMEHEMMGIKLYLKPNAVPSRSLPSTHDNNAEPSARSQRATRRQKKEEVIQPAETITTGDFDNTPLKMDYEPSTLPTCQNSPEKKDLKSEIEELRKANKELNKKLLLYQELLTPDQNRELNKKSLQLSGRKKIKKM